MAAKKNYIVAAENGLNVREEPSKQARVLTVLAYGEKAVIDPEAEAPDGWAALKSGGYVMREFIK